MDRKDIETRIGLLQTGVAQLREKIEVLGKQKKQAEDDLQATYGAIQENINWLNKLPLTLSGLKDILGADSVEVVMDK